MMVADDKINSLFQSITYFLYSLYAAIECNDELKIIVCSKINSLNGNSVTFVVTIGNVEVHIAVELLQKLVDQCNRSSSVNIIISVNENFLIALHRFCKSTDGIMHVGH